MRIKVNISHLAAPHSDAASAAFLHDGLDPHVNSSTSVEVRSRTDGFEIMIAGFIVMTLFWWAVFHVAVYTERWWGRRLPKSTKEHENNPTWLVRHYLGGFVGLFLACITVPALVQLRHEPFDVKFAHSSHLAFCEFDGFGEPLRTWGTATAFAGMTFTAYTIADLVIMCVHGFITWDYIVHHFCFIAVGLIIRCNCILPFEAAILMAMEVSTPFLNYLLIYRNRGEGYYINLMIAGGLFSALFVATRICLNSWGLVELVLHRREDLTQLVPPWQAWSLLIMVAGGALVQFFWLPPVMQAVGSSLIPLMKGFQGDK